MVECVVVDVDDLCFLVVEVDDVVGLYGVVDFGDVVGFGCWCDDFVFGCCFDCCVVVGVIGMLVGVLDVVDLLVF